MLLGLGEACPGKQSGTSHPVPSRDRVLGATCSGSVHFSFKLGAEALLGAREMHSSHCSVGGEAFPNCDPEWCYSTAGS